jgi:hypothetical protein
MDPQQTRTEDDVEGHRLAANDDEIVVDEPEAEAEVDVEGHRLAANDDEIVIDDEDDIEGQAPLVASEGGDR